MRRKRFIVKFCPVCDLTIWKPQNEVVGGQVYKKTVLNEHGMHFWIKSNNNSVMKIAICKRCFRILNKQTVDEIVEDIKYTWLWEVRESNLDVDKRNTEEKRIGNYSAIAFGETEEEVKNAV